MLRSPLALLALSALALSAPGCLFDPDIDDVASVIEHEIAPAELHPETTVKVGRVLLTVARGLAGLVPDEDAHTAREMLRGVNAIHLGVYEVDGLARDFELDLPVVLREQLHDDGWQTVVRMDGHDSQLLLMARAKRSRIHGAYVIVLERDELVIVKLEGNLSRTIDAAVREVLRGNRDFVDPLRDAAGT